MCTRYRSQSSPRPIWENTFDCEPAISLPRSCAVLPLAPSARDSAWVNALPNSRSQTEPTPGAITPDPPTTPVAPQLIAYAARPRLAPTRTIARALIVQQILCLYNFPERADVAPERSSSDRGQIPIPAAWEIKGNPVRSRLRPKLLIFLRAEVFNTSAMY